MIDWGKKVIEPNIKVFGEKVTFEFDGLPPFTRLGIFDEAYTNLNPADGELVTTEMPIVGIRITEFPRCPRQDDYLVIERTRQRYVIKEDPRVDSHDHAILKLNHIGPCC